jgi:hypothetical protein
MYTQAITIAFLQKHLHLIIRQLNYLSTTKSNMMFNPSLPVGIAALLSILPGANTSPTTLALPKPPAFFLAGDSTTAVQAVVNGGGDKPPSTIHDAQSTI